MSNGNQRIGDIFRVLGSRQDRVLLRSTSTPFMYRSTWPCGCAVDYIDSEVGPFDWRACADHKDDARSVSGLPDMRRQDECPRLRSVHPPTWAQPKRDGSTKSIL
jgi:hypothetical protein